MSKIKEYVRHLAVVAMATLAAQCAWAAVTPYTHYTFNDLDVGNVPSNNETTFKNTGTNTGGAFAMTTGSIVAVDESGNKAWVFGSASKQINSAPNASVSPTTYVTTFSFNGASFSDWKIIWGTNGQAYNGPAFCVKGNATDGYQVAIIRHAGGAIKTEDTYLTYNVPQTLTGYHMWALTMVYQGSAGVYTLYCDGEQVAATSAGGYWGNQNSMFGLGQGGNKDISITPEGLAIDDLQVYNKVLSIKEIQDLAGIETGKLKMNDKWYDTIASALAEVQEGENVITLYAQIDESVTLPANVTVEATPGCTITGTISGSGTYSIALAQSNSTAGINSLFASEQLAGFTGTVLMTKGRFEFNTDQVSLIPSAVTLATSNQGKIYLGSGEWNNHFVVAGDGWTGDGGYNMGPVAMRIDGATFGEGAMIRAVVENDVVPAIGIYNTNPTLCAITGNGGLRLRSHEAKTITISAANLSGLSGTINLVDANVTLAIDVSDGSATVANVISGSGTLKKIGTGNLTLSGENENMNGPITVAAGTLTVGNYKALGPYTANQTRAITVESGATLNNQNHDMTGRKLVISGTGSGSNGAAYITTGNGAQMREFRDGTIILADDATIKIDNGRGIKTQYMEYVFGGHTLTKIGSADLTMRNNWTADTDSGRFVIAAGGIAFENVGVRFGAIDVTVGENGTIKRNVNGIDLAVKSLTLESGATISDSKTSIKVAGALMVGETIKLPNATEGMVVMTVAGDKPTTLPSIADSELALAFDGNDLKVVNATPAGVTITLPTVANTTITKVMSGESEVEVVEGAITVAPGTEVTITYTPDYGYLGGGDLTVTINSDTTTESISTESITTSAAVAIAAVGEPSYSPTYVGYSTLSDAIANGWYVFLQDDVTVDSTIVIDHSVVIDLQGHNVTGNGVRVFQVKNGTVEIDSTDADSSDVIPATISTTGEINPDSSVIRIGGGDASAAPELTIDEGVTVSSAVCYGITAFGVGTQTLVVDGTVSTTGNRPAISGNGTASNGETTITINGTVSATAENAIYQPQAGRTTINGTVTGGIEAKAGAVTIKTGATVSARETTATHTANGDGCSTQGYAVAVVDNAGYKGGAVVTIEGGAITGPVAQVVDSEAKEANTLTITGGTFTVDPSDYVADGYEATESEGVWTVSEKTGPKSWDEVKDDDVATIVTDLPEGKTVTATELAAWAKANEVAFQAGITVPVNALIFYCAPDAIPTDVKAEADKALKQVAVDMDLLVLMKEATEKGSVTIPTPNPNPYPLAVFKLVPATLGDGVTTTAELFRLSIELKQ